MLILFPLKRIFKCRVLLFSLDFQQPVVFANPLAAAHRTGFDLSPAHGYCKISKKGILGFSRAM